MVKKLKEMRGIQLDPRSGHIFLNESYDHWLRSQYGRKFPRSFTAAINDLLDSALLETLDDMKKVIRYYEWKMEGKDKRIRTLINYIATMEESLQRVTGYAEGLEERFARTRAKADEMEEELKVIKLRAAAAGAEVAADATELGIATGVEVGGRGRGRRKSATDILAELRGGQPATADAAVGAKRADIKAAAELEAGDTEADILEGLQRPAEMALAREGGRSIEGSLGMGARLGEAEIGVDDMESSPQIAAIESKIMKVKGMKALHSDEEIEGIFKGSEGQGRREKGKEKKRAKKEK